MLFWAIILGIILILFITCNLIPSAREDYWENTFVGSYQEIWSLPKYASSLKDRGVGVTAFLIILAVIIAVLLSVLVLPLLLIAPAESVYAAIKYRYFDFEKSIQFTTTEPVVLSEKVKAQIKAYDGRLNAIQFVVEKEDISFELDDREVIFYSPTPVPELEQEISTHLESIKSAFASRKYHFFFLPEFNSAFNSGKYLQQLEYYSPINGKECTQPEEALSYEEIRNKLHIPDRVDSPCFIRYKKRIGEEAYYFSYYRITEEGILSNVQDYLTKVGSGQLFSISGIEDFRQRSEGQPADETFDQDVLSLGLEIRERVNQLKARGLTSLAIRKLIGEIEDNPSRLVIDKHNKIFLPDYNTEIKLSPIHKAVFFLFLKHPEGIYFKDLPSYKEELGRIYGSITGREDQDAIDESIDKLTNPFDNSINEKCARIKNAFVSEFREELAQWYFIDGRKGEKKAIKLPRDLVTWEIKE